MKKILSLLLSAALLTSTATAFAANAAPAANTDNDIVLFGDSIAAGYGLSDSEYNYGQICADYLNGTCTNFAVSSHQTNNMLDIINGLSADDKEAVRNAEYIVISVGANDMIHYLCEQFLLYSADHSFLKDGITKNDIKQTISEDKATIGYLIECLDVDKIKAYVKKTDSSEVDLNKASELLLTIGEICQKIGFADKKDTTKLVDSSCFTATEIVPNILKAIDKIKSINSNAQIIIQTIYQPFQLEPEFVAKTALAQVAGSNTSLITNKIRTYLERVMLGFRAELTSKLPEDVKISDILHDFTSTEDEKTTNDVPGCAYYFTNMQRGTSLAEMDFHPNQMGHLAIAASILDTIGDLRYGTALYTAVFNNAQNNADYPEIALEKYKTVARNLLGDPNLDNKITVADAAYILKEVSELSKPNGSSVLSDLEKKCADVTGEGKRTTADAAKVLSYCAYLAKPLKQGETRIAPDDFFQK